MKQKPYDESPKRSALVIGAGIAGLAVAYYLKKHGVAVTILERRSVAGGVIRSQLERQKYLLEFGPTTFLSTAEPLVKLARELSIDSHIVTAEAANKARYVLRKGKLIPVPLHPAALLKSGTLSLFGKARLFAEPLMAKKGSEQESVASFVRRRGGKEVLDRLVDPFISGIYAGDVEQLEAESALPQLVNLEEEHGSLFKGMLRTQRTKARHTQQSFRWGMGTLPARLEELLRREIHCDTTIESVERLRNGRLFVRVEAPRRTFEADAVVIATPAWMTARIVAPLMPDVIAQLMNIPYAPIAIVHTAFPRAALQRSLDGFGFLVPRSEGVKLLGSIWTSALFSGRAPQDQVLLANYLGGATDPRVIELDEEEIVTHVMTGLERAGLVQSDPVFTHVKRLNHAIPQYTIGHRKRIEEIERTTVAQPGIFLAGNYLHGVSVADTIAGARKTADRMLKFLGVWSP